MSNRLYILLILLSFSCVRNAEIEEPQETYQFLGLPEVPTAGKAIHLKFKSSTKKETQLLLSNAYGTTVVTSEPTTEGIAFAIPATYTTTAGPVKWELLGGANTTNRGQFVIQPSAVLPSILETYLGPKSLTAGGEANAMTVAMPTDIFDNPLSDGTAVRVSHHYTDSIIQKTDTTAHLIAWNNILPGTKKERLLSAASHLTSHSKELSLDIYANLATDFEVSYSRVHAFADGNQQITFTTSSIVDVYGNRVDDGTLVSFVSIDSKGNRMYAQGSTIKGIAQGNLLHPEMAAIWKTTAYVLGAAKSNTLVVRFEQAVQEGDMHWMNDTSMLIVGPILSYMGQQIPDGLHVQLKIRKEGFTTQTLIATSKKGVARFYLNPEFYPSGDYKINLEYGGRSTTKLISLQ